MAGETAPRGRVRGVEGVAGVAGQAAMGSGCEDRFNAERTRVKATRCD